MRSKTPCTENSKEDSLRYSLRQSLESSFLATASRICPQLIKLSEWKSRSPLKLCSIPKLEDTQHITPSSLISFCKLMLEAAAQIAGIQACKPSAMFQIGVAASE
eukprot:TRINITY_DN27678_c0_g1_i1.p2 TRINITY_DN27678_c0_g1~~TRINITY_DN27678_c0_g1_i1.p2  ORF type:complete len:105 (+),score=11.35 TRINITY_DN27678_c0_g1_i1:679-993(+)